MVVFNLLAIVVAIIIGIFLGPLFYFFPEFMESTWGNVLAAGIVTGVGIVTDLIGLKGRVFWLPIWLFGLIAMGVNLHELWGWYGPAAAGGLVVVLFAGMLAMGAVHEKKEWAEAPGHLNSVRESLAKGPATDETWELLAKAFFVAAWGDDTPERARHNLEVLAAARKAMGENAGPIEVKVLDALGLSYRAAMARTEGSEKVSIPHEFTSAMQEILGNKGRLPEEDDRKDLLEELNKPQGVSAAS